jgi:hypothetical protein
MMINIRGSKVSAAACLHGLTLTNGWKVKGHVSRSKYGSGGTFSHSYVVEKKRSARIS